MFKYQILKFSHNYDKLHGQTVGKLFSIVTIEKDKLDPELVKYDTQLNGKVVYNLTDKKLMILFFIGNKGIPFTTIRAHTQMKFVYYKQFYGHNFKIKIGK